jgi:hypothetical protein
MAIFDMTTQAGIKKAEKHWIKQGRDEERKRIIEMLFKEADKCTNRNDRG